MSTLNCRRIAAISIIGVAFSLTAIPARSAPAEQNRIVFISNRDGGGTWQIYLMDGDGSNQKRLLPYRPSSGMSYSNADLSPDGKLVVFGSWVSLGGSNFDRGIYIVRSDGSHLRRLTNLQATDPTFSPDGRRIAFVASQPGQALVYVMNVDGSNVVNTAQPGYAPSWRPDGRRVVFNCGTTPPQICAMDDDGANLVHVTNDHNMNLGPQYSPDGRTIVFFSPRVCGPICFEIYAMNPDGSNVRRLSPSSPGMFTRPFFTPNRRILFVRTAWHRRQNGTVGLGDSQIYVMDADGTDTHRLTGPPGENLVGPSQ
jgi:Tol biopolymer transport system component